MEGEGAARDLGAEGLAVRPLERTFPFWSIGANLTAVVFLGALAMEANITFPLTVIYGEVFRSRSAPLLHIRFISRFSLR
jgi:hypothetical protein